MTTATAIERPPKWDEWLPEAERAPEEAWEAVPDPDWIIDEGRPCRFGSRHRGWCRRPSVAALKRGSTWWAYCEQHMFRRWIEGDQVLVWRLKREWRDRA